MQTTKIIAISILAAICYGVIHDQITVRVCLEYFTIGHPSIFPTQNPALLALGWGIIATWWVGLPLGYLLSIASQRGQLPKLAPAQLVRPIGLLCLFMGCSALIFGLIGAYVARQGGASVHELRGLIPVEAQVGFVADLWAHSASYFSGIVGGLFLVTWTFLRRKKLAAQQLAHQQIAQTTSRVS